MFDPRPIAIFGDWHGDAGWALTAVRSAAREGVRTALHVGDFGLDWPGAKRGRYETKLNKYLVDLGVVLIVSGGNHDNWETLAKLPVEPDGTAAVRSNIRVLPRGAASGWKAWSSEAWGAPSASTTITEPRAKTGGRMRNPLRRKLRSWSPVGRSTYSSRTMRHQASL